MPFATLYIWKLVIIKTEIEYTYSDEMNKEFGSNGVALGVKMGSYCSYVQHFINKTISFRATLFEHSKFALIEEANVPMGISQMATNGRVSMISDALKQMARRISDVI